VVNGSNGAGRGGVLASVGARPVLEPPQRRASPRRGPLLDPDLVPTPLLMASEIPAVEIRPLKGVGHFAILRSLIRISAFAFGLLVRKVTRRSTPAQSALRTRNFLEGLGGLWIKAGQIISLRTDVLTREMADELAQLSHRAYGFPPEVARQVLEDSLDLPIEEVFSLYEEEPFAAASISQVHRARLKRNGALVAIKIQRPGIEEIFARDFKLIRMLVRVMKHMPGMGYITWDSTLREIDRIMKEELDYRFEISNLYRLRKKLKGHRIHVPKVYRRLSAHRIIIMEYVTGVLMSDYCRIQKSDPERLQRWCERNNVEPVKVGSRLMRSFYRQLFEDNLFHGDLHPGNIILLRDSRVALIDLGTVGSVEKKLIEYYRMMTQAFSVGDYGKSVDYFLLLADSVPVMDMTEFKANAVEQYRAWEARSNLLGLTYYEKSVTGGVAAEFAQMARKYRIAPSHQLLRVTRSLGTLDANLGILLEDSDPTKIMRKYFAQYRRREFKRLRKNGASKALGVLMDARMTMIFGAETLRQNAIKVHGIQRKVDSLVRAAMGAFRLVLCVSFVVVTYDYLLQNYAGFLNRIGAREGALDIVARRIPGYRPEFALIFIFFLGYLIFQTGRIRRSYSRPAFTLPNGRTTDR
jgi:ubiquinone biosynthesis protein